MRAQRTRRLRTIDNSEIQRWESILKSRLDDTIRSLDRLEDETRSIDCDSPQDAGDRCVMSLSKESLFHQSGERRVMVRLIRAALARIEQGNFGACLACGDDINARRLDALPWTQYCLRCQQGVEQAGGLGQRSGGADRPNTLRKAG